MKVGLVLKNNKEILSKTFNRPSRIIPDIVENVEQKYQRQAILKRYETFQNEQKKNYHNKYIGIVSDLLHQNEKNYYVKRNKLSIKDDKSLGEIEAKDQTKPITMKAIKPYRPSLTFHESHSSYLHDTNCDILPSYKISPDKKRLLSIIHTSDMLSIEYKLNIQEKANRRYKSFSKANSLITTLNKTHQRSCFKSTKEIEAHRG